jgi:hypothetical protein
LSSKDKRVLNVDSAILYRLDRIGDLDQFASSGLWVGVGAIGDKMFVLPVLPATAFNCLCSDTIGGNFARPGPVSISGKATGWMWRCHLWTRALVCADASEPKKPRMLTRSECYLFA